ncbi:hypothetical protein [Paenibacillus sp. MBLB4367]|uniref:hypothetical protein n=1 Tax=Paenibacillus sp. MBLB4367 TaxID=3384767 RepID=UPI0039080757
MNQRIDKRTVNQMIGKHIYAVRKDGSTVSGKLVRLSGNRLVLKAHDDNKVRTSAIIPLVLFDLLAIGTLGAWGGGFGGGCGIGGCGPYAGQGPGFDPYAAGPVGYPGPGQYPQPGPYPGPGAGGGGYFW